MGSRADGTSATSVSDSTYSPSALGRSGEYNKRMTIPASTTDLIVLGLAVARLTSLAVLDDLTEPVRHRIFSWCPPHDDPELGRWYQTMWAGTDSTPRRAGFVGRLVGCYVCASVWIAVAAVISYDRYPTIVWPILVAAATAQIAETAIRLSRKD